MTNSSQLTGPVLVAAQGIFSESSTALHGLGEIAYTNDGRAFRYCHVGDTALVGGKLYQSPAEDTTNFQNLTAATNSIGDTTVTTTSTVTLTANQLAGGFLVIESATLGAGFTYKIRSHPAATGAVVTFTLDDAILVATTGTVNIDVHPNPYKDVIVMPTTSTSAPVGFAVYNVTAAYYGWLCTHGPTAGLAQGTITVGDGLIPAETTTTGAIVSQGNDTHDAEVAYALTGIASGDNGLVFAVID
jgi:hypothetical protein